MARALDLCLVSVIVACAVSVLPARGQASTVFPSDYGGGGFWQTPSARLAREGALAAGVVGNSPYNRLFVNVVPVDGAEITFRYTDITNRLYSSDPEFSGDQSYKDRGLDLRFLLQRETELWPAVALGFRDLAGTQLFSAQYLVASRRYYDLDFSFGLGWGRLGSGGVLPNPLKRTANAKKGADQITVDTLFSSRRIGILAGLSWDTPVEGLQLVAEYDNNDYQSEPFDNDLEVRWPVNLGAKYRFASGMTAGLSWQRGSIFSFHLAFGVDLATPSGVPKVLDPAPPQMEKTPADMRSSSAEMEQQLRSQLEEQRISLQGFSWADGAQTVKLQISPAPYRDSLKLLGRTARAAAVVLPERIQHLQVVEKTSGVASYQAQVPLTALREVSAGKQPAANFLSQVKISPADVSESDAAEQLAEYPQAGWSLNPVLRSSIGGPDRFYFGQLWLKLGGYVNFTPNWSLDGVLGFNIYNNFDDLKLESDSQLPRVRSDIKNYLKDGEQALVRLESNYIHQFAPTWYGRLSGGLFEEMYGGVAGELLYRPDNPHWALGVNVNRVRQRDFDQRFSFRDYQVTTGHVTGYFEFTRPSVLVKLSAGQYLAGDRGATLDVSRQFPNGIRIGAFATKTNVSAQQFGEGEFDKGIYFILPLDVMLPRSTSGTGAFLLRPLTRDGGQMVRDGRSLYDITYGAVKARLPLRDGLFFE